MDNVKTSLTRCSTLSNNSEVVEVNSNGEVEAVGPGETAILIRASGTAVSALVGVISEPIPNYPEVEPKNFIDEFVFAKLRQFNIIPSELSSDAEFLRRVCLDLTGTLPPAGANAGVPSQQGSTEAREAY